MRTITLVILGVVILGQQKSIAQPMDEKNKKKEKSSLEQFTKKLKEKQPGWSITTRLKDEKEDLTEIEHNKRITKKVEVRSYWMVLDENTIEITKEKYQGGFDGTFSMIGKKLKSNRFGNITNQRNCAFQGAFPFTGLRLDHATGLTFAKYRFLLPDSQWSGNDLIVFPGVENDSTNFKDPSGLEKPKLKTLSELDEELKEQGFRRITQGLPPLGEFVIPPKFEKRHPIMDWLKREVPEAEKGKLCLQWVENVNFKPVYIPASTEIVKGAIKGASIPYNFGENEKFKFEKIEIGLKLPLDLCEFGISSKLGAEKKDGVTISVGIPMKSDKEYKIYLAQVAITFTKPGAKVSDVKGFIAAPEAFQPVLYMHVIPEEKK